VLPKLHFGDGDRSISNNGTIRNNSDAAWKSVFFEVQFFNRAAALIDTATHHDYGMAVPAHSEVSLRIRHETVMPREQYDTHKVFIRHAENADRW
jgi:hypothetical protein